MKFTKRLVGHKKFGGTVEVTDPCYERSVWCRRDIEGVKQGNYACVAWVDSENHHTVAIAGIYLNGCIGTHTEFKLTGEIGVDAGLAGFFINKPDYTQEQWNEFCKSLGKKSAWIRDEGFFTVSGFGDGAYPVYVRKNKNGEVTGIEISFYGKYKD